jgi:hypothetical protein
MKDNNQFKRLLDKDIRPSKRSILNAISRRLELWKSLKNFLDKNYDFQPELKFFGKKYGWCHKYRRKGKTLCVVFPETNAFTVLVVLGKNEIMQFSNMASEFNENTRNIFENAHQYFDGKWVYKRVLSNSDLADVKQLIKIKKKPAN